MINNSMYIGKVLKPLDNPVTPMLMQLDTKAYKDDGSVVVGAKDIPKYTIYKYTKEFVTGYDFTDFYDGNVVDNKKLGIATTLNIPRVDEITQFSIVVYFVTPYGQHVILNSITPADVPFMGATTLSGTDITSIKIEKQTGATGVSWLSLQLYTPRNGAGGDSVITVYIDAIYEEEKEPLQVFNPLFGA